PDRGAGAGDGLAARLGRTRARGLVAPTRAARDLSDVVDEVDAVVAPALVVLELYAAVLLRVLEQLVEVAVAGGRLVEVGMHAPQRLLDHRAPDDVVVLREVLDDLEHEIDRVRCLLPDRHGRLCPA